MKHCSFFLILCLALGACQKNHSELFQSSSSPATTAKGGGGGNTTAGFLSSVGGAFRLIGGNNDSIQVNFTQPAPTGGWVVSLRSNDPAVQLPLTYNVPPGAYIIHPPLTSSVISSAHNVTITATLASQSVSYVLKVFPLHYVFPAPQLQTPGNGSGFKNRIQVKFQWSDNVNAYYHDIQISDNATFANPMLEVYLNDPIWAASYFNGLGVRYWRVRYIDGSGTPGPWSAVRNFEVKP